MSAILIFCMGLPLAAQSSFQGSVTRGQATATPLMLSLQDAIDRGLKSNLGLLERDNSSRTARAERLKALSALLPSVTGNISETGQQIDLATFGFRFGGFPTVIGPFGYTDIRASATATLLDWSARRS